MLKLYFARHTLIFGTVWDLLRGRPFDFWAGAGAGIGYLFIYIYIYILQTDFEEKKFLKGNTWRKKFQKNIFRGV